MAKYLNDKNFKSDEEADLDPNVIGFLQSLKPGSNK